jgi:nucleoside-diphosphate-sugar epimerase
VNSELQESDLLIKYDSQVLVTGARGFIGKWVVARLLDHGFTKIRCLARPSITKSRTEMFPGAEIEDPRIEFAEGNLLSHEDCLRISRNVQVIYHLAAGRGEKSFASAYLNSVITTRNLLDASLQHGCLKRFVNVSSFTVYTNRDKTKGRLLDETCPIEQYPAQRGSSYCFAKVRQEEMVLEYGREHHLPYVIVRPGVVYGPGNEQIHGRVGIGTFGLFLHLGGTNHVPLVYVENCAEAVVLAGMIKGIDGQIFNVVDDDLPTSRRFLRLYKKKVKRFPSIYVPHLASYILCSLWEKYSAWSQGQLPNAFNRKQWHASWKKTFYSNNKIKQVLEWVQRIPTNEGLNRYFLSCREKNRHA